MSHFRRHLFRRERCIFHVKTRHVMQSWPWHVVRKCVRFMLTSPSNISLCLTATSRLTTGLCHFSSEAHPESDALRLLFHAEQQQSQYRSTQGEDLRGNEVMLEKRVRNLVRGKPKVL